MEVLKEIKANPNKLPFLQAQVLIKIYTDIKYEKRTTFEELAELTDYPANGKILQNALKSLLEKGFIEGEMESGFNVPVNSSKFYNKIIRKLDYKTKNYSTKLLFFHEIEEEENTLFDTVSGLSELNRIGTIHKWYNYLEEFPYSLIEDKFRKYDITPGSVVADPFAGSGTTLITSKMFHCKAIGFDVNPLMTFISKVKTEWDINLNTFKNIVVKITAEFLEKVHNLDEYKTQCDFLTVMPKKEINQWLSPTLQKEVALLKDLIEEKSNGKIRNLLLLAMSKACFDASYVSLCPGTTFYPFKEKEEFWDLFTSKITQIYFDLKHIKKYDHYLDADLINDTCINASKYIPKRSLDFAITSPPYPNDLEYTRQTRLELYLLDFVKNMNDVQKIKKGMVKGSTKLIFKDSNSENFVMKFKEVKLISDKIYEQTKDKNWGFDYPRMIREYFGDMYLTLKAFHPLLKKNAHFLLVVGDQTIKSVYIPVCDILIEMAKEIGYKVAEKELFRMRRSTGHDIQLPEEIVILQK